MTGSFDKTIDKQFLKFWSLFLRSLVDCFYGFLRRRVLCSRTYSRVRWHIYGYCRTCPHTDTESLHHNKNKIINKSRVFHSFNIQIKLQILII